MITAAILTGCGNNAEVTGAEVDQEATEGTTNAPETSATPEPTKEPKAKKLAKDEQIALDYVNIYINGTDAEANKKFVADHIHPDAIPLFSMGVDIIDESDNMSNPTVKGSAKYDDPDLKGVITLVEDDNGAGVIVLSVDGKIAMAYSSSDTVEEMKAAYDEMKAKIK